MSHLKIAGYMTDLNLRQQHASDPQSCGSLGRSDPTDPQDLVPGSDPCWPWPQVWWACRQYVITVIPLIPGIWSLLALAPGVVSMQAVCDHSDPTDPQDLILAGPGPRCGEHAGSMWSPWSHWSQGSDPCWPWPQVWWACRQYVITVIPLIPRIWSLLALAPGVVSMQAVCDHSDPTDSRDLILAGPGPRCGDNADSMWSQWSLRSWGLNIVL